jgi:hypothetical protein
MTRAVAGALLPFALVSLVVARQPDAARMLDEAYLSWSAGKAQDIGEHAYIRGRVGGLFDGRLLKTERAYNYKLAATLLSPAVIRATARVLQLRSRLTPDQTRALVTEAEGAGGLVIMVEIDPREGSGVIPMDWEAFLQPEDQPAAAVGGVNTPVLRNVKALAGVLRRNYDYDRFWVVFPDSAVAACLESGAKHIELLVRIHDKEGRAQWPASLLAKPPI